MEGNFNFSIVFKCLKITKIQIYLKKYNVKYKYKLNNNAYSKFENEQNILKFVFFIILVNIIKT